MTIVSICAFLDSEVKIKQTNPCEFFSDIFVLSKFKKKKTRTKQWLFAIGLMSPTLGKGSAIRTGSSVCVLTQLSCTTPAKCHSSLSADPVPLLAVGTISAVAEDENTAQSSAKC